MNRGIRYIGIDPGLHGGIAIIIGEEENETHPGGITIRTRENIKTFPMPLLASQKGLTAYDHFWLKRFFELSTSDSYAILEQQQAMPKQGVVSMLTIGYGFGTLKQGLVDFAIPHEIVRAQVWQKEFGISGRKGNTKAQALRICQGLFPDVNLLATQRAKKPHDGIVDSLLIAEFGRRRYKGGLKK